MGLRKKYKKSLEEKWCMRFKTRHPDGDAYDGVVLHLTREFVVLGEIGNFEFSGIQIFPLSAIKGYRDNKFDDCYNRILSTNGQLKRVRAPAWISSCQTLAQVVSAMAKRDIWPAVELVFAKKRSALYIGPIVAVEKGGFYINCYDAAGKWEKVYWMKFNEVFRLEFGSAYTEHFNTYMRHQVVSLDS